MPWLGGNEVLLATLAEIGLSNRLVTSMKYNDVHLVGQFVQLTEPSLFRTPNLGRNTINASKKTLAKFGLHLGMELQGWDIELAQEARKGFGRNIQKKIFELDPKDWPEIESLEDELMALLLEVEDERNAEMLFLLYGFDGLGPKTLESVGESHGLTRERVRQIAARAEKKLASIWRPMKFLDAARILLFSGIRRPFSQTEFSTALKHANISRLEFHVEGLFKALEITGQKQPFCHVQLGRTRMYGKDEEVAIPKRLIHALRRETSANGCTNVQRLALLIGLTIEAAPKIRDILLHFQEVLWLDEKSNWLLSKRPTRSRLANVAGRVFSVSKSVEVNELRAALLRPVRVTFVPPANVLENFLEFHDIAYVDGRFAIVNPDFEKVDLGVNDMGIALAFQELGSPLTREQLEDYCLDDLGMNANSFYVYLSYSPLISKLATGVFSLVGHDVDPGEIEQLKEEIKQDHFEASFGWSKAGTLWWHFQADRPTIHAGSHIVPPFVLNLTEGQWTVKSIDGLDFGTATVANSYVSGLKLAFSVIGMGNKDYVQIDFDLAEREAFVRIVGDEHEEFSRDKEPDEFDHPTADD